MSFDPGGLSKTKADRKVREAAVRRSREDFPSAFPANEAARHFLNQIIIPASGRWAFISTGKNGSSSTLRFLFEAEFGVPLSVGYDAPADINPSAVAHQLAEKGVFARALGLGLTASDISCSVDMLKICVVRNPHDRAASAFAYLCRSDRERSAWFLADRLKLNAFGFDWRTMPGTVEGFRLFLRFVEQEIADQGAMRVNGHWRPQVDFIHPQVYRPDVTGRLEDMDGFFDQLRERLGVDASAAPGIRANEADAREPGLGEDPEVRALVEAIYADDFETFEY